MIDKITNIIKKIKIALCKHEWINMGRRVVYKVEDNGKPSNIPCMILYLYKCRKCGKERELRTEINNGIM